MLEVWAASWSRGPLCYSRAICLMTDSRPAPTEKRERPGSRTRALAIRREFARFSRTRRNYKGKGFLGQNMWQKYEKRIFSPFT